MMMANALTNPDMAALDEHPTHPTTESESKETSTKEDGGSVLPKESNDWEELMGSDLLLKALNEASSDAQSVQAQDCVVVDFVGRYAPTKDVVDGPIFHEQKDYLIAIGDKIVLPALEMGARFLSRGATARVWSHSKFAYGPAYRQHGEYTLPPNANVMYEITVKSILSAQEMGKPETLLRLGRCIKEAGNDSYLNEWADGLGKDRIMYVYSKGVRDMQSLAAANDESEEVRHAAMDILIDCLNNKAAVLMRAKEYHACKETTVQVLTYDPNNYKALIRAAKASLLDPASDFVEVKAAIDAAAERSDNANDVDVRRLKADFLRRKQEYDKKSKAMFSRINDDKAERTSQNDEDLVGDKATTKGEEKNDVVDHETSTNTETTETAVSSSSSSKARYMAYAFQLLLTLVMALYLRYKTNSEANKHQPDEL